MLYLYISEERNTSVYKVYVQRAAIKHFVTFTNQLKQCFISCSCNFLQSFSQLTTQQQAFLTNMLSLTSVVTFVAPTLISSNLAKNGQRFSFNTLRSVVPASGVRSKPTISDILSQCRPLIPLLHKIEISGRYSYKHSNVQFMQHATVSKFQCNLSHTITDKLQLAIGFWDYFWIPNAHRLSLQFFFVNFHVFCAADYVECWSAFEYTTCILYQYPITQKAAVLLHSAEKNI